MSPESALSSPSDSNPLLEKRRLISKIIAAMILGVLLALVVGRGIQSRYQMDRETYLAKQAAQYDARVNHPLPLAATVVISVGFVCITVVVYEALVSGIFAVLKVAPQNNDN